MLSIFIKGEKMNINHTKEYYPFGTKITFTAISAKIAKKLFIFALYHRYGIYEIKINGVTYSLEYVSFHGRFNSVSVYFSARNRLYRISDHWSYIGTRGGSRLTSCEKFGKGGNEWTLTGPDNAFDINGISRHYIWRNPDTNAWESHIWDNGRLEGGYVEWRNIKFK